MMEFADHTLDALEREPTLEELVPRDTLAKVHAALRALVNAPLRITNASGDIVAADAEIDPPSELHRASVHVELEPVGYLESPAELDRVQAAARVFEMLLMAGNRYRLASAMHTHTVRLDYEELQRQHAALLESEARYRELNANLERRVDEQVKTLDTAQRHLYQAEKLAAIGQLAGGMAHEINNPIGFVHSNLTTAHGYVRSLANFAAALRDGADIDVLRRQWQDSDLDFAVDDFSSLLQESLDGANRVIRIVAALREFARIDQADAAAVDINAIVRSAVDVVQTNIAAAADVRLTLGAVPMVRGRAAHLGQLCLNVLTNAAQALVPDRPGAISVETYGDVDEIRIVVRDNGCGIPAALLPRVREPFFTTKEVGAGAGLGLTVCNDIARAHGGRLTIESEVGVGTSVTVHVPLGHRRAQ